MYDQCTRCEIEIPKILFRPMTIACIHCGIGFIKDDLGENNECYDCLLEKAIEYQIWAEQEAASDLAEP
jgi:hypothetical protein